MILFLLQYPVIHIVQWYTICSSLYDNISLLLFIWFFFFFWFVCRFFDCDICAFSLFLCRSWCFFPPNLHYKCEFISRWNVFWVIRLSFFFLFRFSFSLISYDIETDSNKLLFALSIYFLMLTFFFTYIYIYKAYAHSQSTEIVLNQFTLSLYFLFSFIISISSENQINFECDRIEYSKHDV